jgi:hypothetical protein
MRIGRGNWSIRRKPAPVPLCTPQIPHDLTWDRTRAAVVGSQQLTAWAMARPSVELKTVSEITFISVMINVIHWPWWWCWRWSLKYWVLYWPYYNLPAWYSCIVLITFMFCLTLGHHQRLLSKNNLNTIMVHSYTRFFVKMSIKSILHSQLWCFHQSHGVLALQQHAASGGIPVVFSSTYDHQRRFVHINSPILVHTRLWIGAGKMQLL